MFKIALLLGVKSLSLRGFWGPPLSHRLQSKSTELGTRVAVTLSPGYVFSWIYAPGRVRGMRLDFSDGQSDRLDLSYVYLANLSATFEILFFKKTASDFPYHLYCFYTFFRRTGVIN